MPEPLKLSIVIPTYNRNQTLLANLAHLLPQLTDDVELIISDNASPTAVAQTLAPLLASYPVARIRVVRNLTNIGAYANILRSYERATHPWLWVLSDDDVVSPTAVADIFACIAAHPDTTFINFATEVMAREGLRPKSFDTQGQAGFVQGLDYVGNVNFMSVSIWRVEHVLTSLGVGYNYAYSMSPSFVLLLSALGEQKRCHFSSQVLIRQVTTVSAGSKWRLRDFVLGWNTILELPMPRAVQAKLALKMASWHAPENVCVYFLADAAMHGRDGRDYAMVTRRLAGYSSLFQRLRFFAYRALFVFPKLGWLLVETAVKAAMSLKLKSVDLTDIIERSRNPANDRR
jgi:glycosyltransferase involved in cell wall biosynthesis